jgi:hypothetical protein
MAARAATPPTAPIAIPAFAPVLMPLLPVLLCVCPEPVVVLCAPAVPTVGLAVVLDFPDTGVVVSAVALAVVLAVVDAETEALVVLPELDAVDE